MEKSQGDRVKECVNIMKKLTDSLQLPADSEELIELREHMNTYIKTGDEWTGTVDFSRWGRIAHCVFPKKAKPVEVTLKAILKKNTFIS
jgi:hypothetical protein